MRRPDRIIRYKLTWRCFWPPVRYVHGSKYAPHVAELLIGRYGFQWWIP